MMVILIDDVSFTLLLLFLFMTTLSSISTNALLLQSTSSSNVLMTSSRKPTTAVIRIFQKRPSIISTATSTSTTSQLYNSNNNNNDDVVVIDNSSTSVINGDNKNEEEEIYDILHTTTEFITDPIQVYIEETDAYGIIYNTNYLRAYDRALHRTSFYNNNNNKNTNKKLKNPILQHDGWSIISVDNIKYKKSPALGTWYRIRGKLIESTPTKEIWDMEMISANNNDNDNDEPIIYNVATGVTIALTSSKAIKNGNNNEYDYEMPNPEPLSIPTKGDSYHTSDVMYTYRDEFDSHLKSHLPLTKILNLFERSRSNMLGGPNVLQKLQNEYNMIAVVTKNDYISLVRYYDNDNDNDVILIPGEPVEVDTVMNIRRSSVIDFYHTIYLPKCKQRIAQGIVQIYLIDETTKRPVKSIPDWLFDQLLERTEKL